VGKFLINYILNDIKAKNATTLQLNVNRKNAAIDFYEKLGFKVIGSEDIDIGKGYFMNDYIMALDLNIRDQP
jgi:ribosomal protein S18 acetylase RimI-like enzyme